MKTRALEIFITIRVLVATVFWITAALYVGTGFCLNFQKIKTQLNEPTQPVHLTDRKLLNLHPDVFQEHVEASLKWSLKTLTEGDIKYYLHVSDIGTKKSKLFSTKAMKIQEADEKKKQTASPDN